MTTHASRARWAAIGAVLAVCLGAGSVGIVDAVTSSGERAIFTSIPSCRLTDTRPQYAVGGRASPVDARTTINIPATGDRGQCRDIPSDAVALGLNVTALQATDFTHLTFWASGPVPNGSSLNPAPNQPPTPNAVTVELANNGSFNVFNFNGSVHLIIDVVGFYRDHNHDDRYYTKAQTDQRIATGGVDAYTTSQTDGLLAKKADKSTTYTRNQLYTKSQTNGLLDDKANKSNTYTRSQLYTKSEIDDTRTITRTYLGTDASPVDSGDIERVGGECASVGAGARTLVLGLDVPVGSTVTDVEAHVYDGSTTDSYTLSLYRNTTSIVPGDALSPELLTDPADGGNDGTDGRGVAHNVNPDSPAVIATGEVLSLKFETDGGDNGLCAVSVNYDLPAPSDR